MVPRKPQRANWFPPGYGNHDAWTLTLMDYLEFIEEDRERAEADAVEHIQHGETLTVEEE